MVVGILRKILGGRPVWDYEDEAQAALDPVAGVPGEVESLVEEVLARLHMAREELEKFKYSIAEEVNVLFEKYKRARALGNRDEMEVAAAEYVLKKKMLKAIIAYIKMLDVTIARIRDARDLAAAAKVMIGLSAALRTVQVYLSQENPEIATKLAATLSEASAIISTVGNMADNLPVPQNPVYQDPEVSKLLTQTYREAIMEAEKIAPSIEKSIEEKLDYEKLEARLLDYIKRNNGVLKVREAAAYLGVTPTVVKELLYRLQKKGVIRISGGGQASTA